MYVLRKSARQNSVWMKRLTGKVLFHNTECGNKGNKLKSWLLLLLSLFPSYCIGFSLWGCHVRNEQLKKPEGSKQVQDSRFVFVVTYTNYTEYNQQWNVSNCELIPVQSLQDVLHARLNESFPEITRSSRVTLKMNDERNSKWMNRSRTTYH